MNAHYKCVVCGKSFWCRALSHLYEPHDADWELRHSDGDICDHVYNGGEYEIIDAEPYVVD